MRAMLKIGLIAGYLLCVGKKTTLTIAFQIEQFYYEIKYTFLKPVQKELSNEGVSCTCHPPLHFSSIFQELYTHAEFTFFGMTFKDVYEVYDKTPADKNYPSPWNNYERV